MVKRSFMESILACSGGTSSLSFSECTLFSHWGTWPSFRAAVPPAASACRCLATTSSPFILSRPQPRFLSFLFSTHKFVNTSRPTPAPCTLPLADSDITYVQSVESDRSLCSLTPQRPLTSKKGAGGFKKYPQAFHKHLVWHLKINSSTLTPDQCWPLTAMYSVIFLICWWLAPGVVWLLQHSTDSPQSEEVLHICVSYLSIFANIATAQNCHTVHKSCIGCQQLVQEIAVLIGILFLNQLNKMQHHFVKVCKGSKVSHVISQKHKTIWTDSSFYLWSGGQGVRGPTLRLV